jgi:mono/diheme cytochrome c family protein
LTRARLARGQQIFLGQIDYATFSGCHGMDRKGTPMGPDPAIRKFLGGDASVQSIARIVMNGVPNPKAHSAAMPPDGGVSLSQSDTEYVAA